LGLLAANHAIQIAPAPSFGQIGQEDYMNNMRSIFAGFGDRQQRKPGLFIEPAT
jgi:hypothetical protein